MISFAMRAVRVYSGQQSARDRRQAARRERRRRRRDEPEIERGVDLLLEATKRRRVRVDERVRLAAEEEVLADEEEPIDTRAGAARRVRRS